VLLRELSLRVDSVLLPSVLLLLRLLLLSEHYVQFP
jgi:hypothetical protein